ncbi:zinc finger, CCHC-type containing protein [Tanacetum coccineum]|uniref:Zinc finger, CCHC-type containing protein n=1 Tax=Tanacetum coccineum TaxID=301880 RepID=A0ABQ5HXX3_9ASTR
MQVLQGDEFEVEPHDSHTFEEEPHENVDNVVGSQEAAFAVAAVEKIYAHESLTFNNTVACEVISKWKAGLKDDMDARLDVYVLSNGCKKCSDDSYGYYWESTPGDCDVEKNGKWSCIYAVGSQEYQMVCTRLDIASADVGMLDKFDRGLQTDVQRQNNDAALCSNVYFRAAYMTLTEAAKEAIWLKRLAIEWYSVTKVVWDTREFGLASGRIRLTCLCEHSLKVKFRQLRIVLLVMDKLDYLEQPIPPAPVPAQDGQQAAPEALAAHAAWVKGSKEIAGIMLMTMEPEIQLYLENLNAFEMLQEVKTLFAQQADQELLQTTRDFHSCKQEEGQSASSYVLKMKSYIDNLERLGHPVTLGLVVSLMLIGLRKEFDSFMQNYNMHSLGKTINELHAMLKLHEQTLPKNNAPALHVIRASKVHKGENKLAYAPKPKIPPPPKREDPAKDSICHECGETGHWKRNCP